MNDNGEENMKKGKAVLVSICCLTYNHKKYIRETLDGILKQKTDFAYEILIHDDASTDHTQDIIREYESKYPEIIKPIYQTENQYSKGAKISYTFQYPRAAGKYIALCEGDDYWIDENKLSKQISYMEEHSECSCTFHAANYLSGDRIINNDRHYAIECDISAETIIKESGGYCATASLCFCKEIILKMPQYMQMAVIEDYPTQIWLALNGIVHYFPDIMSVYRLSHPGSWSDRFRENREMQIQHLENGRYWLTKLNEETHHKYRSSIYYRLAIDAQNLYRWGAENYKNASVIISDKNNHFSRKERYHLKIRLVKTVIKKHFPILIKIGKRLSKYKTLRGN